jgi:hypothetical protein
MSFSPLPKAAPRSSNPEQQRITIAQIDAIMADAGHTPSPDSDGTSNAVGQQR